MGRVHTHYDNLKVTRNAPFEVMKAAYRAMAQKYHPDLNPAPDAARVMKLVNEAWHVVSDPTRRAEHDKWIADQEAELAPKKSSSSNGASSFKHSAPESTSQQEDSGSEGQRSSPSPPQNKKEPSATAQTSKRYGSFSDASEGYKAATPDWLRSLNHAILNLNKKLGTSSAQVYGVFILGTVLVVGMGTLTFVSHRTDERTSPLESRSLSPRELSDAEVFERHDSRNLGSRNASASQKLDKVIADTSRTQTPSEFKPFNGVLDVPKTDRAPQNISSPAKGVESDALRLPTGYLKGEKQSFMGGLSKFRIDNSNGSNDADVRLYLSGKQVRAMFVRVGTTFTAENLSPGTYKMRYKMNINGKPSAFQAKDDFVLTQTVTQTETGTSTRFSNMTVTLYKVQDGNMQVEEIPLDKL